MPAVCDLHPLARSARGRGSARPAVPERPPLDAQGRPTVLDGHTIHWDDCELCPECDTDIPRVDGSSWENRWHDPSCTLHDPSTV